MAAPFPGSAQLWAWVAIGAAALWLLWLLSPILAPFLFAAILAYVCDPLVERLTGRYLRRTFAVVAVLFLALLLMVAFTLIVMPLFVKELRQLVDRLPQVLAWINEQLAPWINQRLGTEFQLDVASVRQLAGHLVGANQDVVAALLGSLKVGGLALVAFFINVLLVPVVLFYLLRDWHQIVARVDRLVPRPMHTKVSQVALEIDGVLAEFLRGQLLVIVVMSLYYVLALWLAGLQFALPIGLITGMLVIVPYVGAITGIALGTIAALMQFDSLASVAWIWFAFGLGQVLEGMVMTPLVIGERIGLHPVVVIFALLAFGQVFGFFGILLALPVSAALLVGWRHLRHAYVASSLYGDSKPE